MQRSYCMISAALFAGDAGFSVGNAKGDGCLIFPLGARFAGVCRGFPLGGVGRFPMGLEAGFPEGGRLGW